MARFKRKRPKNRRAGCLLCKPYKINGAPPTSYMRIGELRRTDGQLRRRTRRSLSDPFE